MPVTILLTGCVNGQNAAICDGSSAARDAHTIALLDDGGDRSLKTGAQLLALLDAACGD